MLTLHSNTTLNVVEIKRNDSTRLGYESRFEKKKERKKRDDRFTDASGSHARKPGKSRAVSSTMPCVSMFASSTTKSPTRSQRQYLRNVWR